MKKIILLLLLTSLLTTVIVKAQDWPNLKRYQAANETLKDSTVSVVYMGDSLTDFWLKFSPESLKRIKRNR